MRTITAWMLGSVFVFAACGPAPATPLDATLAPAVVDATEDAALEGAAPTAGLPSSATLAPAVVDATEDAAAQATSPTDIPSPTPLPTTPAATATPAATSQPTVTPPPPTDTARPPLSGVFVRGEVAVTGSFTLDPAGGVLRLSEDFKVDPGPDLFVVLSGADDLTLSFQAFSQQVLARPLLRLAPLSSFTGGQSYLIPANTDLSPFKTVVIWCNAFSVEFAAAPLNP